VPTDGGSDALRSDGGDGGGLLPIATGAFTVFGSGVASDGKIIAVQSDDARQTLHIFDSAGAKLATLDDEAQPAGVDPSGHYGVFANATVYYLAPGDVDAGVLSVNPLVAWAPASGKVTLGETTVVMQPVVSSDGANIVYGANLTSGDNGLFVDLLSSALFNDNTWNTMAPIATQTPYGYTNAPVLAFAPGSNLLYALLTDAGDAGVYDQMSRFVINRNTPSTIGLGLFGAAQLAFDPTGQLLAVTDRNNQVAIVPTSVTMSDAINAAPLHLDRAPSAAAPNSLLFVPGQSLIEIVRRHVINNNFNSYDLSEYDYANGTETPRVTDGSIFFGAYVLLAVSSAWIA
jgi:hypothetical protein